MMNTKLRVIRFGALSGMVWSLVPAFLSEIYRPTGQMVTVVFSGILSGIIVSSALAVPLRKPGEQRTLILSLVSLPFGAFVFGVTISFFQLGVKFMTGISYRAVEFGFDPLSAGFHYALFSSISIYSLLLFPIAIFTTFMLKKVVNGA